MEEKVFELDGVSRSFGSLKAVDNLTLSLGKGEVTPSASTTLLAILFPAMFFFGRRLPDYAETVSGVLRWLVKAV